MATENGVLRWGVMGTGSIASAFVQGLKAVENAQVTAVGSRTEEGAARFADRWAVPRRHADYRSLAQDPEVDVVYVATPHPAHHPNTLMCLEAGKHVLCEKPLAMNALQVAEMIAAAKDNDRFLMEALWTRYLPASRKVHSLVAQGAIGELRSLSADFGISVPYDPEHRLFSPELGGGALLDLGVYPLAFASHFLGELTVLGASRRLAPNQMVDSQTTVLVQGEHGVPGMLSCSTQAAMPNRAVLVGTRGWIQIERFWCPTDVVLHREGHEPESFSLPLRVNGYEYEAEEVTARVLAGERESPDMPWDESLRIARLLDLVRDMGGLVYSRSADKATVLG